MKKIIGLLAIAAMGTTLAACGDQASQNDNSARQSSTQSSQQVNNNDSQQASSTSSSHHDDTLWNNNKDEQLESFINKWAPTMHQSYEKYDGQNQLKVSTGVTYPQDLDEEQVEGQPGLMGWAPTGKGDYDYNVVAIYNYDGTEPPLPNRITYFFAFHDGKPVVLVDQSNNGDPNCKPTSNQDVASNFERIANE